MISYLVITFHPQRVRYKIFHQLTANKRLSLLALAGFVTVSVFFVALLAANR